MPLHWDFIPEALPLFHESLTLFDLLTLGLSLICFYHGGALVFSDMAAAWLLPAVAAAGGCGGGGCATVCGRGAAVASMLLAMNGTGHAKHCFPILLGISSVISGHCSSHLPIQNMTPWNWKHQKIVFFESWVTWVLRFYRDGNLLIIGWERMKKGEKGWKRRNRNE